MTRSYCCWRMLGDTLQSTWPVLSVMARACAMSSCIVGGMLALALAGPTHTSVEPLCSNSLPLSWASSAPQTRESTTLVGNRSSIADSRPSAFVVFTRMHVC